MVRAGLKMVLVGCKIIVGFYGSFWLVVFVSGGGVYSQSSKKDIDSSVAYYHEIRDNLNYLALLVDEYRSQNDHLPGDEIFAQMVADEDLHYVFKGVTTLHRDAFPEFVTKRFGIPNQPDFAISIWTGDEYLSYASWVNGNSADVSVDDFGIPRVVSGAHVALAIAIFSLLSWKSLTSQLTSRLRRRTH